MAPTDAERLAKIETTVSDSRDDIQEIREEMKRTRERLHGLEASTRGLILTAEVENKLVATRQRSLEVRMQALTGVIAIAALAEPFLYKLAGH